MESSERVHIIGAGLAGLASAVRLAARGAAVTLYEAAGHAGGRCRTFYDRALEREIDNGNHLIMSGNRSALDYLTRIGAGDQLTGPRRADYPFIDVESGARWRIRINDGPIPAWIFDPRARVPGTGGFDYLRAGKIALARADQSVADVIDQSGYLYERFWEPLTFAALNTTPARAQARLLWSVIRETFAKGGKTSRPLVAKKGLSHAFVEPALSFLASKGAIVRLNARLRAVAFDGERIASLSFGGESVKVDAKDEIILALPPSRLKQIIPSLDPPGDDASILNVHYRTREPVPTGALGDGPFIGMLSSDAHWAFVRGDVVSLTISASHAIGMDEVPNERVAEDLWRETQIALGIGDTPYEAVRVIRERRATPDQSPTAVAKRLKPETRWLNLTLAGDHTDTGIPATIEGAIRSGNRAADIVMRRMT